MSLTSCLALIPFLLGAGSLMAVEGDTNGSVVVSGMTNALRLRLYTDASPDAAHLFNTFDVEAFGQTWLQSPGRNSTNHWRAEASTNVRSEERRVGKECA